MMTVLMAVVVRLRATAMSSGRLSSSSAAMGAAAARSASAAGGITINSSSTRGGRTSSNAGRGEVSDLVGGGLTRSPTGGRREPPLSQDALPLGSKHKVDESARERRLLRIADHANREMSRDIELRGNLHHGQPSGYGA